MKPDDRLITLSPRAAPGTGNFVYYVPPKSGILSLKRVMTGDFLE